MTQLKQIGTYSIDTSHVFVDSGSSLWAWVIFIIRAIIFFISMGISNFYLGCIASVIFISGWISGYLTDKKVPAFRIELNNNSLEYPYIDSRTVIVSKDTEKMTRRVQKDVDYFISIINQKIKESEENERVKCCMADIEQKVKVMIK